ncbi:MAG: hypothetical protein SGILL_010305, partial [Bacillariaceae sp.]
TYDLEEFVQRHPGGIEAILLGKGRDCTALVASYHPFSQQRVWNVLEKYLVVSEESEDDVDVDGVEDRNDDTASVSESSGSAALTPAEEAHDQDFFYQILKDR